METKSQFRCDVYFYFFNFALFGVIKNLCVRQKGSFSRVAVKREGEERAAMEGIGAGVAEKRFKFTRGRVGKMS